MKFLNFNSYFFRLADFVSIANLTSIMTGVALSVIVTFNRMKQLSTDFKVIVAAVNASQSGIIEVCCRNIERYYYRNIERYYSKPVLSNLWPTGRMRPADRFCSAREVQQKSTKIIVKDGYKCKVYKVSCLL